MLRATALVAGTAAGVVTVIAGASSEGAAGSPGTDWMPDRPGRTHHIDLAHLPSPYASDLASNPARVVPKPPNAHLQVPQGFKVEVVATGLEGPRTLRLAPNGDLFVAETRAGRIVVVHPSSGATDDARAVTFAQGLDNPFGMQFYPRAHPQWIYVAETNRVVRYPYRAGEVNAGVMPEVVVPELAPSADGGHITRDLVLSPDERRMFVSVGSRSNVADDMPKKSSAEIAAWQATHALGAAWGDETARADVLAFDVADGGSVSGARVFATGLRNCVGLTIEPTKGALWCTVNERDMLGDDLVPDYSTRVREGGYYGWPWYYMGNHEDPRLKGQRPDLAGKALRPDVPYQSHSAPLNLIFYTARDGRASFPQQYVGDGFAVLHGSWNRSVRTGYKVVRVRMRDGVPTGEYDDFLVGFVVDAGDVWGRPVGALEDRDGSLLISDDGANAIYRISYSR